MVYGSIDEIEESFWFNIMNDTSSYSAHYLSNLTTTYTYVLLNFFTKHYHYFVKLLYDSDNSPTYTHGYTDPVTGNHVSINRKADTDYNFDLPAIAPCNTDYWNVKFRFSAYDISEHMPPGQVSPGTLVSFNQEAELLAVGPNTDRLNTGSFVNGWFRLGAFVLDVDDAKNDASIKAMYTTYLQNYRYIPAIGYLYVDAVGYGQWRWNLTVLDNPNGVSAQP